MIIKYAIMPEQGAVSHSYSCNCSDCYAKRRDKAKAGHHPNCICTTCKPTHASMGGYGGWGHWNDMASYSTKKCDHFRQPVTFDKYTILCSSYRGLPSKTEELVKFEVPDLGVYLDYGLWSDHVDPIKVSPGLTDYPSCDQFYKSILIKWPDRGVIPDVMLTELVDYLQKKVEDGEVIDIGCHGGHGRTGTLLGCLIARLVPTMEPEEVIKYVREKYCKEAIESRSQEEAIYKIVGKVMPPPPPVVPTKSPYIYEPDGTGGTMDSYSFINLESALKLSKEEKVKLVRPDNTYCKHECVECHNDIPVDTVMYHDRGWVYKICPGCYAVMGGDNSAWYKATPVAYKEVPLAWEYTFKSIKGNVLTCDDCKIPFKMGEKIWYQGKDWTPTVCDLCHGIRLAPKEPLKDVSTIPDNEEEKDQFAYILGYDSYKDLSKSIKETLAKA